MDVERYRLFLKVVELGNLTKAATMFGYTQSGASRIISAIENELGVSLMYRDSSGMRLTVDGVTILPAIREAVSCDDKIHAIANSILGVQAGTLRVAAFTSISLIWIPRIISRLSVRYPNIKMEIISGTGSYTEMTDFLSRGIVDCSFITQPAAPNLHAEKLMDDPLMAVFPPNHPLSSTEGPISFSQLENEAFVMPADGKDDDFKRLCLQNQFTPRVAYTMHDDLSILSMVENGLGCAILPGLILNNYASRAVAKHFEGNPIRTICIATRRGAITSPLVTAFSNTVHEVLDNR